MVHVLSGEWPEPSEAFTEDPHDPNQMVSVTEFDRRRESIDRIHEVYPLLGLIVQCLSNVASHRPDAADIVCQLQAERARVPPRPENRLELIQQIQSLRAEQQQNTREENEALRGEMTARARPMYRGADVRHTRQQDEQSKQKHEWTTCKPQKKMNTIQGETEPQLLQQPLAVQPISTPPEAGKDQVRRRN